MVFRKKALKNPEPKTQNHFDAFQCVKFSMRRRGNQKVMKTVIHMHVQNYVLY